MGGGPQARRDRAPRRQPDGTTRHKQRDGVLSVGQAEIAEDRVVGSGNDGYFLGPNAPRSSRASPLELQHRPNRLFAIHNSGRAPTGGLRGRWSTSSRMRIKRGEGRRPSSLHERLKPLRRSVARQAKRQARIVIDLTCREAFLGRRCLQQGDQRSQLRRKHPRNMKAVQQHVREAALFVGWWFGRLAALVVAPGSGRSPG
jgi:hypothetical protein